MKQKDNKQPPTWDVEADGFDGEAWTLDELCQATGESARTVRFYILNGLLSAPTGSGPGARYPAGHAIRLRIVRALQAKGRQLSWIRDQLEITPPGELDDLLELAREEAPPPTSPKVARSAPSKQSRGRLSVNRHARDAPGPLRSRWDHIVIEPGVELHVRRPLSVPANRRVRKMLEFAHSLIEEK